MTSISFRTVFAGVLIAPRVAGLFPTVAVPLLVLIGGLAGFFVVPMNALLQQRGHHMRGAGRSIAVQNFNERGSILEFIACCASLFKHGGSIYAEIVAFGLFVTGTMLLARVWYGHSLRRNSDEAQRLLSVARSSHH